MVYTEIDLKEFRTVKQWLRNLAESTQRINLHTLKYYLNWIEENSEKFSAFTPDDLIEYQIKATTHTERYELLDLLQTWINSQQGRVGYKTRNYAVIRGFYKRNRALLFSDPDFNIRSETPKAVGDLSINEAKDIIQNSNLAFKAAYLCMFQGGMDGVSFEYWNTHGYESLRDQLKHDPDVVKVDLPGRKKQRNISPFYTLFGGDAIEALRDYLKTRPDTQNGAIILNAYGKPLSANNVQAYWRRLLKRRGFVDKPDDPSDSGNRYNKSVHELRDVFRTQWQKAPKRPSPQVAEFLMGHGSGDSNEYNKFARDVKWVQGEYLKALPMLQIMSEGDPFGQVDRAEVDQLKKKTEEQNGLIEKLETRIQLLEREKRELPPTLDSIEAIVDKLLAERLKQTKS